MCGCAAINSWTAGEAPAPEAAPAAVVSSAGPVEVELVGTISGEKTAGKLIAAVLEAYSQVPLEPILRIETQARLRAIHALALAPRGKVLATLGLTFFARPTDNLKRSPFLIYFFDPAQKVVARTLEGVPGRVHHLAYSHNGRYLAVAYGADNVPELGLERIAGASGARIYDAKSLALLRETTTETPCQWVDFDSVQQLYAVCQRVVLQYTGLQLLRMRESEGGVFTRARWHLMVVLKEQQGGPGGPAFIRAAHTQRRFRLARARLGQWPAGTALCAC